MAIRFRPEAFFLLVGGGLLAAAVYAYYAIVVRPAAWPRVDGLIVSSRVINPGGPEKHSPELVFRLSADDSTRDVTVTPSWSSSSYDMVRSHVDQFPAGERVQVAVNPDDPNDVRYDLGATSTNMIAPGVLALIGTVFFAIGAFALRPSRRTDQPVSAGTIRIVPPLFILIGAIVTVIGALMIRSNMTMVKGWPEIEGRVVESRVVSRLSSGRKGTIRTYVTSVKFGYAVNGVSYQNETTSGVGTSNRDSAVARATAYSPGTVHRIWHRPGDPNVIRFDLDSTASVFFMSLAMLAMGLIFLSLGGMVWWFMARGTQHEG